MPRGSPNIWGVPAGGEQDGERTWPEQGVGSKKTCVFVTISGARIQLFHSGRNERAWVHTHVQIQKGVCSSQNCVVVQMFLNGPWMDHNQFFGSPALGSNVRCFL